MRLALPKLTIALTFLTHLISAIDGVHSFGAHSFVTHTFDAFSNILTAYFF